MSLGGHCSTSPPAQSAALALRSMFGRSLELGRLGHRGHRRLLLRRWLQRGVLLGRAVGGVAATPERQTHAQITRSRVHSRPIASSCSPLGERLAHLPHHITFPQVGDPRCPRGPSTILVAAHRLNSSDCCGDTGTPKKRVRSLPGRTTGSPKPSMARTSHLAPSVTCARQVLSYATSMVPFVRRDAKNKRQKLSF